MTDTSQGLLRMRRDIEGTDWRNYAACRDVDPELFFPIGTTGTSLLQIDEAKQICRTCSVRGPCLRWASHIGAAGIWGGTTEEERRKHRRRASRNSSSTASSGPSSLSSLRMYSLFTGLRPVPTSTVAASRNSASSASRGDKWPLATMMTGPHARNR